jgi:long-subunit fatty acid transport protein
MQYLKHSVAFAIVGLSASSAAYAGGLFLPGNGPISSGRAGAAVASAEDAEAIAVNPAGIAKVHGTRIIIAASMLSHAQQFRRNGSYENPVGKTLPWAGQDYGTAVDKPRPAIGVGSFQALPLLGIVSDLGGHVPGLAVGFAVIAPNAYPTRSIGADYQLDDPNAPPPVTRYDIVSQKATAINPTIAAAYRILPQLDIGARFTWGINSAESRRYTWGNENYAEWVGNDSQVEIKAKDTFVPSWSVGASYRPTANIEIGAQYTAQANIGARGESRTTPSADLRVNGSKIVLSPPSDTDPILCDRGGRPDALKACADFALPMFATVGARYQFLDAGGNMRGDIELDAQWENWSAERATTTKVRVDGYVNDGTDLKEVYVRHGFTDTVSLRAGGSYVVPVAARPLTIRGGVAYDTGAAKPGWERLDFDGASRFMFTGGASYQFERVKFDLGAGAALQGTRNVGGDCNPTTSMRGCNGTGLETPVEDRAGWDPARAVFPLASQAENPVNHGQYKSHYLLFMFGVSTWF